MQARYGVTFIKAILLAGALQGAAGGLSAQGNLTALFPARPTGYVTDVAGALPSSTVTRLNALSERLRTTTGAEMATVVLPTIGDRAAVDVAVAIGRAWGVGANAKIGDRTRNAGLVILLVPKRADDPNSGQIFIATGQGLEGIVTDLQASRVRDLMRPYFSAGDYGQGLEVGVGALAGLIAREMGVSDSALAAGDRLRNTPGSPDRSPPRGAIAILILVLVVWVLLSRRGGGRGGPRGPTIFWPGGFGRGGGWSGGGFGGFGGGGGGFGGFGGGGGFSGGGAGGRF